MEELTARQESVLEFVRLFIEQKGYPPTRQEIADAFDFASANGAEQHLRALEHKGFITIAPGISRGIALPRPARSSRK